VNCLSKLNNSGFRTILNLRLVCKTMKGWVDNLMVQEGRRAFVKCHARLDFKQERILEEFINSPLSPYLTSFVLVNVQHLKTNPTALKLWPQVVNDWLPKLMSLDVNALTVPSDPNLDPLLMSTTLVELRVGSLLEYPDNSNQLPIKERFYKFISSNPRLKSVDVEIKDNVDLIGVNNLLETRKHDSEFQITLRFFKEPEM